MHDLAHYAIQKRCVVVLEKTHTPCSGHSFVRCCSSKHARRSNFKCSFSIFVSFVVIVVVVVPHITVYIVQVDFVLSKGRKEAGSGQSEQSEDECP